MHTRGRHIFANRAPGFCATRRRQGRFKQVHRGTLADPRQGNALDVVVLRYARAVRDRTSTGTGISAGPGVPRWVSGRPDPTNIGPGVPRRASGRQRYFGRPDPTITLIQ